jgi:hypothetical protein
MAKKSASAKKSCNRGNKRGSIKVRSHSSKGNTILCYRRKKASHHKKSAKKSGKRSQKK